MQEERGINHSSRTSLLVLILAMIIFGTVGICRRFIPLSSGMLAFARGLLGTLFLVVFVKARGGRIRHSIGIRNVIWLIVSGAAIGFNWILLFEAYNYTTVAVATLSYYMQPTIVILVSPLLLRERLTVRKLICSGAAILGMVLVSGVIGGTPVGEVSSVSGGEIAGAVSSAAGDPRGIFYGLGAAVLYASVIVMNKKVSGVDAFEKTILQLASATVVMVPYLLLTEDFSQIRLDTGTILLVLLTGLVHTGLAYAMYFASMERLKAQTIAIFSYIDPVTALILSAVILGETLSPAGIIGAILILGAAAVSELRLPGKENAK